MLTPIKNLLELADAFCKAKGLSRSTVSTLVFNDGKILANLERGADMNIGRHANAVQWFSNNWPEKTRWPSKITRPPKIQKAA